MSTHELSDIADRFLVPQNTTHRHYEALRAYLFNRVPGPEVARRFGYTPGSLQQLVHQFRQQPDRRFFLEPATSRPAGADAVRERIIQLRKQNQSIYDISEALKKEGCPWRR